MYGPHDLRIEEVELPELRPFDVLIELKACGICQSDVECFEGESTEGRYDIAPYTPGHEWSGKAVAVGSSVTSVKVGDKVVGDCVLPCYNCANCKDGKMPSACLNMRETGFRPDSAGGMGEYLILEEMFTHVIPQDWDYEWGAWVETFNVGYWGLRGCGCFPDAADTVVVIGAGPIGLCTIMVAKESGARVIVTDPIASRRENALNYGADYAIDPYAPDYLDQILEITDGRGADIVVECSGNDKGIASVFDVAGHGASVGLMGHSIGRMVPVELGKTIWKTLKLSGSGGTDRWFPRTIRFMSAIKGKYDFAALNTHHFHFEDLHKAFDVAANDKENARKVMLTFDKK